MAMARFGSIFFHLSLVFSTIYTTKAQQQKQTNVTRGSSLTPMGDSTSWLSPSGLYAFGFYPQAKGYAVGIFLARISQKTVVWTANRDNLPFSNNATLRFTTDGRLIVDQTRGQEINIANDVLDASYGSMQDNGNFVLYNSDSAIVWQSFDYPTDTLLAGQRLKASQTLISSVSEADQSKSIFRLVMQQDGNLVQYPIDTPNTAPYSYWASGTDGSGANVTVNLDADGFLYLRNDSNFSYLKNLTQGRYPKEEIYHMKLDVDGIFRVYKHDLSPRANWFAIWSSDTNKCVAKGLCGVNGYCVMKNDAAQCTCLPGFDFVNPEIWSLGCERNYTAESCKSVNASFSYSMIRIDNIQSEDAAYYSPKATTQEQCSAICLADCNCEAAVFSEGQCKMQRLPLRYLQKRDSYSDIAFIKYSAVIGNLANPSILLKKKVREDILVISISFISFAIFIFVISLVLMYRNKVWAYKKISENLNVQLIEDVGPRSFSYAELERYTDGFKEEIGSGSFGIVYKGTIESSSSRTVVAVKKLKKEREKEGGEREFQTEVKIIGRTHHRNLVRLLGYCNDGPERILVFEFMTKGSLADMLFQPNRSKPYWEERICMATEIARGILYLHEECETQIIHCDIKPQNILVNEYGCVKISDFGLAKLLEHDQTRTFTGIRGTRGYVAPEWHKKLPVTVKADIYSFGIVLLEILCCRKNADFSLPEDEVVLEEWVCQCYERDELLKLVGDEEIDERKLNRMVKIALWCIQDEPSLRPTMKKVLLMLEGTVDIPIPPNPTSFLSAIV